MKRRNVAWPLVAVLPFTCLTGCGLFSSDSASVSRVDELVSWVERVHVESEVAKEIVRQAEHALATITVANFAGDPVQGYADFVGVIEQCENQALKLDSTIDPMKEAAEPVFEQWATDLLEFTSVKMRLRSHMRLEKTRERYHQVLAVVGPTQSSYQAFNMGLRDIALFLAHDFNAASVAEIQEDVRGLRSLASELTGKFDACLVAARAYVETSSLPAGTFDAADPEATMRPQRQGLPAAPAQPGGAAPANEQPGQQQPGQQPPGLFPPARSGSPRPVRRKN